MIRAALVWLLDTIARPIDAALSALDEDGDE